jgi:hypothetical protein
MVPRPRRAMHLAPQPPTARPGATAGWLGVLLMAAAATLPPSAATAGAEQLGPGAGPWRAEAPELHGLMVAALAAAGRRAQAAVRRRPQMLVAAAGAGAQFTKAELRVARLLGTGAALSGGDQGRRGGPRGVLRQPDGRHAAPNRLYWHAAAPRYHPPRTNPPPIIVEPAGWEWGLQARP